MSDEKVALRLIERTKITKYAPGVDPKDPKSVPYEVVEESRELSPEETQKALTYLRGMYRIEFDQSQANIDRLKAEVTALESKIEQPLVEGAVTEVKR